LDIKINKKLSVGQNSKGLY